jgi:hypothetical protein
MIVTQNSRSTMQETYQLQRDAISATRSVSGNIISDGVRTSDFGVRPYVQLCCPANCGCTRRPIIGESVTRTLHILLSGALQSELHDI